MPSIWSSTLNFRFERFQMSLSSDEPSNRFVFVNGQGSYLEIPRWADLVEKNLEKRAKRMKMGKNGYRLAIGYKWVKMDIGHAQNQEHHNHAGNT